MVNISSNQPLPPGLSLFKKEAPAAPAPEAPAAAQPATPAVAPVVGFVGAALGTSRSGLPTNVSLFGAKLADSGVNQDFDQLNQVVGQALQMQKKAIPAKLQQSIQFELSALREALASNQPQDQSKALEAMSRLSSKLAQADLLQPQVKAGLNQLLGGVLRQQGAALGIDVRLETKGTAINGLRMLNRTQSLSPAQRDWMGQAQNLVRDVERAKSSTGKLSSENLLLLSLRDELLRRSFEMQMPKQQDYMPSGEIIEKDLGVIRNLTDAVDKALASSRNLPPDMLKDLQNLTRTVSQAPDGGIAQAVNDLRQQTAAGKLNDLSRQFAAQAQLDKPDLAGLDENLRQLNQDLASATGPAAAALRTATAALSNQLQQQSNSQGAQLQQLMQDASSQLKHLAAQGQQIRIPQQMNQIVDLISSGIGSGPPDIGGGMAKVIDAYSQGMSGVESHLPPLLFPVTLPVPLAYSDHGNTFILPAGSKLSQDRKTKAYAIQTPGFYMQTGGTTVQSGQASIQLGKDLDRLQMATLGIRDSDSNTLLTGVDAQINRQNHSALIRADKIEIDNSDGQIHMTNARLVSQPDRFELGADQFLYQQGQTQLGVQGMALTQSKANGVSNLTGQANQVSLNNGSTILTAEHLTMQMQASDADGSSLMQFSGDNVDVLAGQDHIHAASGSFGIFNHPDGSSKIELATQNASWSNGTQSATASGDTHFNLIKDAQGRVQSFNAHGDDVQYSDGNQALQVVKGDLSVNYGANGLVSGVQAKADSMHWTGDGQSLNAAGGQFNLNYDDKGQISGLSGDLSHLDYAGQGQRLNLDKGHIDASYGPNGTLAQINAHAGKVDFTGADGSVIQAVDSDLTVGYYDNGKLKDLTANLGSVDLQTQGNKLHLSEAGGGVHYNENGSLSQIDAHSGLIDWQNATGDRLNVKDLQGKVLYDGQGQLQQISASAGDASYSGSFGQISTQGKTTLDLLYGPNGQLQSAQAATDKLSYLGEQGKLDLSKGQIKLDYDANGQLSQAATTIGEINYAGTKGDSVQVLQGAAQLNYNPDGTLNQAMASAGALHWKNAAGDRVDATGLGMQLDYGKDNLLKQASANIASAQYAGSKGDTAKLLDGAAQLQFNADGSLRQATAHAGELDWKSAAGDALNVKGLDLKLDYSEVGKLTQASAAAGDITYNGAIGQLSTRGQTTLNALYNEDGSLKSLAASSENLSFVGKELQASATKASLTMTTQANGQISQITGAAENLKASGSWGDLITQGQTSLSLNYNELGGLSGVQAHSDQIDYTKASTALSLTNANLALGYDAKGNLSSGLASIGSGKFSGDFGTVELAKGGQVQLNYGANGQLSHISAGVESLAYAGDKGKLDLLGARLNAQYGADGLLDKIDFSGDKVDFSGKTGAGKPIDFKLADFKAGLQLNHDGSQAFDFSGKDLKLALDQHNLSIPSIQTLQLRTGSDGAIAGMDLHLDGHNTYSNPDLSAALDNLEAHYTKEGNTLSASFDKLSVDAVKAGVKAEAIGGKLFNDDSKLTVHVDSASLVKTLESELKVKVENVDLIVDKTQTGGVASADLLVGQADALVSGMNLMVRTQNGDQVRLHLGMSEDGTYLKEAFLQIPTGGEIQLSKDDLNVKLGGGMKLGFSQDGQGLYTFRGEGLKVDAATKDATVKVDGGTAQVSIDSKNGELIIDEIKGLNVNVAMKDTHIQLNVKDMEGFLVKATGISGLAQGAAIHLVPTSDGSSLTAELRADYKGIPVRVQLDNVHELEALGTIQPNRAHVYFGDPSGRGQVKINAGPLEMKGSAIEFLAEYHTYNSQRMLSSLGRALSSDGVEIFKGVQIEADGVLRAQTPWKNGLHAGLTVMFPRPMNYQAQNGDFDPNPIRSQQMNRGLNDGAPGAIVELGGKGTTSGGTTWTGALHAGLVPGSYLSIDQTQGSSSIAGIPLPKHVGIPTTGIAGVTVRAHGQETRVDAMAGVYVNPGAFGPKEIVAEGSKYGGYAGVNIRKKDYTIGFSTTVDMTRPSKPDVAGMVSLGFSF